MSSGCVVGMTSTCSWLPLRCCNASAWASSRCFVAASRVAVVSMTGPVSGGMAASCCACARAQANSNTVSATRRRSIGITPVGSAARRCRLLLRLLLRRLLRLRRRSRLRGLAEIDLGRFLDLLLVLDGEVRLGLVAEHHRGEVLREGADEGVVVLNRGDVTLAFHRDAVLGTFQLRLQL